MPFIAETTVKSLRLRLHAGKMSLASATGFVVSHETRWFLVTNHHVVTGVNPITDEFNGKFAVHPETVDILHNASGQVQCHVA